EAYSRAIGRNPEAVFRLAGVSKLPPSLRASAIEQAKYGAALRTIASKMESVTLCDLYSWVMGENAEKLTQSKYRELCDILARCAIGLAPDPRFALTASIPDDVMLFP